MPSVSRRGNGQNKIASGQKRELSHTLSVVLASVMDMCICVKWLRDWQRAVLRSTVSLAVTSRLIASSHARPSNLRSGGLEPCDPTRVGRQDRAGCIYSLNSFFELVFKAVIV